MNVSEEDIFKIKTQLQKEIQQYEQQLQQLIVKQKSITKVKELAKSVLEYNELERQIGDRSHLFALFSSPPESLLNPYVKSELFSYIEAAETISPEMVDFLASDLLIQVREAIQTGEDDEPGLIQAEFKEYILPAKIIGERFDEIDTLMNEMNNYCKQVDHNYDPITGPNSAESVLKYAFQISITADTRMEPTIRALREHPFQFLSSEARQELLGTVEEHLAVLRFESTKDQNIAMEKAVHMLEERGQ